MNEYVNKYESHNIIDEIWYLYILPSDPFNAFILHKRSCSQLLKTALKLLKKIKIFKIFLVSYEEK